MDPFDIPIEPTRPPHVEVDPSLRTITRGEDQRIADIDAPVPEVRATTEEHLDSFELNAVTHVVIHVTISRQTQIFKYIGYQYNWDLPAPFWVFLGRIVAKAGITLT
ncbi:hypothetical protein N658DRAFT_503134 [Parathielavia hyrcaniae]|uniref:Uncharacterized protein n=1 Tax=Parathielavia hyrcaniae TaxID=113614 RepID=A0AAN6QAR2_9PEZI|nr:hypothetical protein N658DRAFT_503134 [Parathielavia hyrcaniae]